MNRDIRDEILVLGYFLNATLRRFSQSKLHFDFEDDSRPYKPTIYRNTHKAYVL